MSDSTVVLVATLAVVGLGVLFVATTAARRDRAAALGAGQEGREAEQTRAPRAIWRPAVG